MAEPDREIFADRRLLTIEVSASCARVFESICEDRQKTRGELLERWVANYVIAHQMEAVLEEPPERPTLEIRGD